MFDLAIVLILLAAAIVMFAINKPRLDAVALIMLTVLPLTGIITMGEVPQFIELPADKARVTLRQKARGGITIVATA